MDARQVLVAARALIADEANWGQGAAIRNKNGRHAYCSIGAICVASGADYVTGYCNIDTMSAMHRAIDGLAAALPHDAITDFNDTHTHAEVLAAFDRAIASLAKPTDIGIFTSMLSTPLVEHQSALDTCGNG